MNNDYNKNSNYDNFFMKFNNLTLNTINNNNLDLIKNNINISEFQNFNEKNLRSKFENNKFYDVDKADNKNGIKYKKKAKKRKKINDLDSEEKSLDKPKKKNYKYPKD